MLEEIKRNHDEQTSVLDLLLGTDVQNVEDNLPTASFKISRLSQLTGRDVVFKLRALPYSQVHDLERFTKDVDINILLAGCVEPNLKDESLQKKFGGVTPAETVKHMLLAGEIADLSAAVEKLSGYRHKTISEVKKD